MFKNSWWYKMGKISEIYGLLFELVLEMKNIYDNMIERMDKLGEKMFVKILFKI